MLLSAIQFVAENEDVRRQLREEAAGVPKPEMAVVDMHKVRAADAVAPVLVRIDGVDHRIELDGRRPDQR